MAKTNYFGITDTGKVRTNNEDTFIAKMVLKDRFIAACVIDGVGGYEGGEVAASLAHDAINETLKSSTSTGDDIIPMLLKALEAANEKIFNERQANTENEKMACVLTLSLIDIANNKFYYAHVGDTRLYLFRDSLVKVSRDQSFVGFLEDSGRLTEEAAMRHPKRNEINKALGFDAHIATKDYIETGESPFLPGDLLLLCSDGLTDMINNSAITAILTSNKTLAEKGNALIVAANEAGGKDNVTAVLVWNDKSPLQHEATKPIATAKVSNEENDLKKSSETASAKAVIVEKKKGSSVPALTFLCILLFASTLWLLYKTFWAKEARAEGSEQTTAVAIKKERNEQEIALISSINSSDGLVNILDSANGNRVVISDSILLQSDSLRINGHGVTLVSDSIFKGPAFVISPACKYLFLDSITFENFDVGLLLQREVLYLKNVQFKNCNVPIQYQFLFPNNAILNGRITDTIFHTTDSL
jgi:serine/threonine protein phosphatase PrpC